MNFSPSEADTLPDSEHMVGKKTLLNGYEAVQLKAGLYRVDVLGDRVQTGHSNSEWRRLGEALAHHLHAHQQSAVLVSTQNLEHYLLEDGGHRSNADNSASFEHEGKRYVVTCLERSRLKQTLPDILESEEFVFCLNAWLCFFDDPDSANARVLCHSDDTAFVREMKLAISNLNRITQIDLALELIVAVSDGVELLWFNPKT